MPLDPFDKSRCSFPVPDFASEEQEWEWSQSLTPPTSDGIALLMQVWRWGEEAMRLPMDRTKIETLTMEEFVERKRQEDRLENEWRAARGLPLLPAK